MEKVFKTQIFTPATGLDFRLNSKKLIFGSLGIMVVYLIFSELVGFSDETSQIVFFSLFVLMLVGSRWGYNEKQKKHGKLEGNLTIDSKHITVRDEQFSWKDITNLQFNIGPVLDESLWDGHVSAYRIYGGPAYSAGVDNYISFEYLHKNHKINFRLDTPSHKVEFSNLMKHQFFEGYIELQPTYDGLQLDYEQIQELKRQKTKWYSEKSS